ncbi:MAG: TonB-dependent receptor [Henriciella sp.]|nr:TonB-dependent receptor [Henriciella sp.]
MILAVPGESGNELRLSGSSLGRYKGDLILGNGNNVAASLSLQKDNGWRDNSGSVQTKASAITEFQLGRWEATAWVSGANLEQETAGFLRGTDAYLDRDLAKTNPNPEAYRNAWSLRAAVRLERDLGEGTLILTPFARTQTMDFRQHFLPYRGLEENSHSAIGLMSRYQRELSDTLTWRIGGDIDLATGELSETQPEPFGFFPGDTRFPVGVHYDYSVDTTVGAVWGELEWAASKDLKILTGLRGEAHNFDYTTVTPAGINGRFNVPADRSDSFDFVTPKLGVIWDASDTLALYANYARGSRAPQASDLYRLQSQQNIAEAKVETLDSLEIGARGAALNGDLVFDIATYWMDKENFFFRDSDGLNVTDGSTRHQGVEAAFDWTIAGQWAVRGTAAWSDQTYTFDRPVGSGSNSITDGDKIDTAPEWLADLSLVWRPTDKFEAALSAEYVGDYFTDPANTNDYPGHTVAHLRGSYDLADTLSAYVIVRNLFDEAYADRADFAFGSERYFPGEPLNVTFGIRKRFE